MPGANRPASRPSEVRLPLSLVCLLLLKGCLVIERNGVELSEGYHKKGGHCERVFPSCGKTNLDWSSPICCWLSRLKFDEDHCAWDEDHCAWAVPMGWNRSGCRLHQRGGGRLTSSSCCMSCEDNESAVTPEFTEPTGVVREKKDKERKCCKNIDISVKMVRCGQSRPACTVQYILCRLACFVHTQRTTFT
jgi:hypothetical protein